MSVVQSRAIVLAAVKYGDTSRIVKLATRDFGLQSAIAKGAMRPKSRFGAALQLLSSGVAQLYMKESRELQTLAAFDLQRVRIGLARDVARWAAASMLGELVLRFALPEAQPEIHDLLEQGLDALEGPGDPEATALHAAWQLVTAFGFGPALDSCARDGEPIPDDGPLAFSARDGGALCPACARTGAPAMLDAEHRAALAALLEPEGDVPVLGERAAAAHRRLLARYVRAHLADVAPLPALDFWLAREWTR